jgi:hypothetical protein
MIDWKTMDTAPQDGTKVWGWLYDTGIVLMHWMTAEQAAAEEDGDPEDYEAGWVMSKEPDDYYTPRFWKPLDAIGVPPGVAWIEDENRWRDVA